MVERDTAVSLAQILDQPAMFEAPSGIAVDEQDGIAIALVDIVQPPLRGFEEMWTERVGFAIEPRRISIRHVEVSVSRSL